MTYVTSFFFFPVLTQTSEASDSSRKAKLFDSSNVALAKRYISFLLRHIERNEVESKYPTLYFTKNKKLIKGRKGADV